MMPVSHEVLARRRALAPAVEEQDEVGDEVPQGEADDVVGRGVGFLADHEGVRPERKVDDQRDGADRRQNRGGKAAGELQGVGKGEAGTPGDGHMEEEEESGRRQKAQNRHRPDCTPGYGDAVG